MRIAFYAPLKPIDHPIPSGDRLMGRAFLDLLCCLGHEVEVASRLRTYDRTGDSAFQLELRAAAAAEAARILAVSSAAVAPELWFTYHAYHKAPDWLGPAVSRALGIPYVVAEVSIAGKQANGPWALGHQATIDAVDAAAAVLAMTRIDQRNLAKYVSDPTKLVLFPPFLTRPSRAAGERGVTRQRLAAKLDLPHDTVWLVTVAMMRPDIKAASYHLLARCLSELNQGGWHLLVVGDGPAGPEIRGALRASAGDKVRFLGEQPPASITALLGAADIFAWPGLREAYCMAILEALAAGLPVVACDGGGISDLVEHGQTGLLAQDRSAEVLASYLDRLIADSSLRRRLGAAAAVRVVERHSVAAAEARLAAVLKAVTQGGGPLPCS